MNVRERFLFSLKKGIQPRALIHKGFTPDVSIENLSIFESLAFDATIQWQGDGGPGRTRLKLRYLERFDALLIIISSSFVKEDDIISGK
jgi:hypothetical protein